MPPGFTGRPSVRMTVIIWLLATSQVFAIPLIVAHRGASHDAPENTLAAFRLAWDRGADAVEGDFRLTADGHIVCLHDETTERTAPAQPALAVAKSTLKQLRRLDVGRWKHSRYAGERIPTLEDVLATVPDGRGVFVEIKCGPEILPALRRQLAASGLRPDQITIISFSKAVIRQSRRRMPQYAANWLTSYRQDNPDGPWKPAPSDVVRTLRDTQATGLGSKGNLNVLNGPFIRLIRDAGCGIHVWTVNSPDAARKFAERGVDSITTDRPALLRTVLERTAAEPPRLQPAETAP